MNASLGAQVAEGSETAQLEQSDTVFNDEAGCTFGRDIRNNLTTRAVGAELKPVHGKTLTVSAGLVPSDVVRIRLPRSVAETKPALRATGYPKCRFFVTFDDALADTFIPYTKNGQAYAHGWKI